MFTHRNVCLFTGRCLSWQEGTYSSQERDPTLNGGTYLTWVVPTLERGYLPWPGGTYLGQGYLPWMGVPTLLGIPSLNRGTYLGWGVGVPTLDRLCCGWCTSCGFQQKEFLVSLYFLKYGNLLTQFYFSTHFFF